MTRSIECPCCDFLFFLQIFSFYRRQQISLVVECIFYNFILHIVHGDRPQIRLINRHFADGQRTFSLIYHSKNMNWWPLAYHIGTRRPWAYQRQYARSAAEGRCSCGGHRARTTRDVKSAAAPESDTPDRPRPTPTDRPWGTSVPLVSSTAEYYDHNIIIIINIHHGRNNNTGIFCYYCV